MTGFAVAKRGPQELRAVLEPMTDEMAAVCFRYITPERIIAATLAAAGKESAIYEADRKSLYLSLMKVARWGLDIGDGVDLVVIGGKVDAWPDYRGLKALAMRQNIIRSAEEYVVYEGEPFEYQQGSDPRLVHVPKGEPGQKIVGAYSWITRRFDRPTFNFMYLHQIEAIRAKSRSWGPGKIKDCPPWYAKKTVIRDWLNRQPKSGALADAFKSDDVAPEGVDADGVVSGAEAGDAREE
jgi:phage RecT family recombinase